MRCALIGLKGFELKPPLPCQRRLGYHDRPTFENSREKIKSLMKRLTTSSVLPPVLCRAHKNASANQLQTKMYLRRVEIFACRKGLEVENREEQAPYITDKTNTLTEHYHAAGSPNFSFSLCDLCVFCVQW